MSDPAETQIACPNGCPPGGDPTTICTACDNTGWCSIETAAEIRSKREKLDFRVEILPRQVSIRADAYEATRDIFGGMQAGKTEAARAAAARRINR